jgi:broad specificity phosphatase PhoE
VALGIYLSHPQVVIDRGVPVPQWGLNDIGRARLAALAGKAWPQLLTRIISSDETKAIQTAIHLSQLTGIEHEVLPDFHENDRTATGFLEPTLFEQAADRFFAEPDTSFEGWETASAAQSRIAKAVRQAMLAASGTVVFCGHGAVGSLLKCHLKAVPISRTEDQTGAGNAFAFTIDPPACLTPWTRLEDFDWNGGAA